ncbi:unnamed protein product [Acanthosepion pharaonis]|uniref:SH3 domain-binding glutamic acid-rich protein n=1 Tax=Acanthosepion pharaonis TaxID=158019 RepID=A0A812BVL2_ACAPH|nr:unnamed protein product [Sepia pharaonis]
MVIKVYISSVTCNNQQRKNQHTILSKLQAEKVDFIKIDVTDPKHNQEKLHMRELSKSRKEGTFAVPPQIFNDSEYCGDYEAFADALETQNLWEFLKMKELQDQLKQKIEDDDSLIGFNKEGEEEKKDEEGGEKTKEAIIEEEEKVVEEAKEGDEEEKKKEKEDTKETEADEKTNEEVEKKEEVFADNEQLETQESEESEQKTEIEEKVDKTEVEEEKKTEESENQE